MKQKTLSDLMTTLFGKKKTMKRKHRSMKKRSRNSRSRRMLKGG
jgi:hypothetical protein